MGALGQVSHSNITIAGDKHLAELGDIPELRQRERS